jgi:ribosome-binding factor A
MASTRIQKISRIIKEELSLIIRREINDPRLGFISITDVELTPDKRIANIYISAYGTPEEQQASMDVLERATGFLRGELSRQIDIRFTPELNFQLDKSIERGARVFELLKSIEPTIKKETTDDNP